MTDVIHYSGWAAQPSIRIDCDMSWTEPACSTENKISSEIFLSDDGRKYTFNPDIATCLQCREKIDFPIEIKGFFGKYRFLSNFHKCSIVYDGITYGSTEAAYQASKTLDLDIREKFSLLPEPKYAKKMGREIPLREDWEDIKLNVMREVNILKYEDPILKEKLLNTKSAHLEETNYWNDVFWGTCRGVGQNNLGKILMSIRESIRSKND